MYLHNAPASHSIVPGLLVRSLSLQSRFLYPPLCLIPREFHSISIQQQSRSLETLFQLHYAAEARVRDGDYCHVALLEVWNIEMLEYNF